MKNFYDFDLVFILAAGIFGSLSWVNPLYKIIIAIAAIIGIIYKVIDYHKKWKREDREWQNKQ